MAKLPFGNDAPKSMAGLGGRSGRQVWAEPAPQDVTSDAAETTKWETGGTRTPGDVTRRASDVKATGQSVTCRTDDANQCAGIRKFDLEWINGILT
jgi:hypothetical protein